MGSVGRTSQMYGMAEHGMSSHGVRQIGSALLSRSSLQCSIDSALLGKHRSVSYLGSMAVVGNDMTSRLTFCFRLNVRDVVKILDAVDDIMDLRKNSRQGKT